MDGYSFSEDEKILIETGTEPIYRRSSCQLLHLRSFKKPGPLFDGGSSYTPPSTPSTDKVAFVHDNNLTSKIWFPEICLNLTKDGEYNKIIYGATDWVYEEEVFAKAFFWSPDGQNVAYYRF